MTNYDWSEVIQDFDVLKWKNDIQLKIYQETKDMSSQESIEYFRKKAEHFDRDIAERRKRLERNQNNIQVSCTEK